MKVVSLILALCGSAASFSPVSQKTSSSLSMAIDDMAGSTMPLKSFDPLGLATLGSDTTLTWFRAAELKHSRVAMLATTGYIVQASGWHFPGMLSKDVSFESLSTMKPFDAWDAVPDLGKLRQVSFLLATMADASTNPMICCLPAYHPKQTRNLVSRWICPGRQYE